MTVAPTDNVTTQAADAIRTWVNERFGATVVSIQTQPRWRPHWFVRTANPSLNLLVRGARVDTDMVFELRHEMAFQDLLYRNSIAVPKVFGWIESLSAYVSEVVAGRPDFAGVTEVERDAVVAEYVRMLAAMHALDIGQFERAGIVTPETAEDSSQVGMARFESLYRRQKVAPNPFMEFCLGWLRRHPPQSHGRQSPVVWDSGQFHHVHGKSVIMLDVELGHIGDPMMDLAGLRMRDSIVGYGDLDAIYRRYEELTHAPVDREAIRLHHIAFALTNELSLGHTLREPPAGTDYAINLRWCTETNLYAIEAIAEYSAIALPSVEPVNFEPSRFSPAFEHLVRTVGNMQGEDSSLAYQLRLAFRLSRHVERINQIGAAVVEADLDDIGRLLNARPTTWQEGCELLEQFVIADSTNGHHDRQLIELFWRVNSRAQLLNGPVGSAMARHLPLQPMSV